jgi:MFS family permease
VVVELGFDSRQKSLFALVSTVLSALGCVVGGLLSDRLGRRRMLAAYIACTAIPTFYLAAAMKHHGWIMPVDLDTPGRSLPPESLVTALWTANVVYSIVHGLMYGTRTALFMDVSTPAVAATQFTAYMALLNLTTSYTSWWQGHAIEAWGYPVTLSLDAAVGLVCLAVLPWTWKRSAQRSA